MIKKVVHIVLFTSLTLLIVLSGISFTIDKHVCLENIQSKKESDCCSNLENDFVKLSTEEKSCCSENAENLNHSCNSDASCNTECCITSHTTVQIFKTDKTVPDKLSVKLVTYNLVPHKPFNFHFLKVIIQNSKEFVFHPPNIHFDLNILFRVLRI